MVSFRLRGGERGRGPPTRRGLSLAAYRLVGAREGLELPADPAEALQARVAEAMKPVAASVAAGAGVVVEQAGAAWDGAVDAGGRLATATTGLLGRVSQRLGRRSAGPKQQPKLPQP